MKANSCTQRDTMCPSFQYAETEWTDYFQTTGRVRWLEHWDPICDGAVSPFDLLQGSLRKAYFMGL